VVIETSRNDVFCLGDYLVPQRTLPCQKSQSYMDDDVCREYTRVSKIGKLSRECECASALESVKMYSVASCIQTCQTTAYSQLLVIILLTAGLARGLEVNLSPILVNLVLFMYKSDLIVDYLVIVMFNLQNELIMILPVAHNSVQSFW
jgi:hypothetical protein